MHYLDLHLERVHCICKLDEYFRSQQLNLFRSFSAQVTTLHPIEEFEEKFQNKLFRNHRYYFSRLPNNPAGYGIARFVRRPDHLFHANKKVQLMSEEFQTLNGQRWIDGDVIDAFCCIAEKEWTNCISISTQQTSYILGDNCYRKQPDNWFMYNAPRFTISRALYLCLTLKRIIGVY